MSTYHIAAASSDFDILNLFDTDEMELSQICEKIDTENNSCNFLDYGVTTSITNWNVISLQLARIIEEGS